MSTIAGVLSETMLQNYRARADALMLDVNLKNDFIPYVDSLSALLKQDTTNFTEFRRRNDKTVVVEAMWPNFCEIECDDNEGCEFEGPKPSTNVKDYTLEFEKVAKFSVDESDFINNEFGFAEMVAKGQLVAEKTVIECFNTYAIEQLNTLGGPNHLTTAGYTVNGDLTYIPAANWNANTIAFLLRTARYNKMKNVFGLSGGNLLQQWLLAMELIAANPENVAGQVFSKFPMFFDELNIDTVNDPYKLTYLIDKGAYGIANKAWNNNTKRDITGDIYAFSKKAEGLDLFMDVYYERVCSNDFQRLNVKVKLTADLFGAPTPCDNETTGVLKFICGEYSK